MSESTLQNQTGQPLNSRVEHLVERFIFVGWIILAVIGLAVTNLSPIISFWYWLTMIPVFACTAIFSEWSHARQEGTSVVNLVAIQVAHWSGALIALLATYSFWANGRWGNEDTGLVILLTLAITTFLDGPHCGWRFYLAGIFLFIVAIISAYLKYFMWIWIIFGAAVVAAGLWFEDLHPLPTTTKHPRRLRRPPADAGQDDLDYD
jgi:hypothetical protein